MERVSLAALDDESLDESRERKRLGPALGSTDVALDRYRIAPGEALPGGLHAHLHQEEVFFILEGTATFETYSPGGARPRGNAGGQAGALVTVATGEAIRFAPGEFQSGRNEGEETLVVLAIGAPRDSTQVRIPLPCPACAARGLRLDDAEDGIRLTCRACAASHVPGPCPDCGGEDIQATLGPDARPVAGCRDCGATFETPPVRD